MRYLTTTDPDGKHPLECELGSVQGVDAGIPGGMTDAMSEAEAVRAAEAPLCDVELDMTYQAVLDTTEYDVDPAGLSNMVKPRHGLSASENSGEIAERVVPYTATGANPSYPQDADSGFENAEAPAPEPEPAPAAKAEPEPEVEELNPAGIPAPPD